MDATIINSILGVVGGVTVAAGGWFFTRKGSKQQIVDTRYSDIRSLLDAERAHFAQQLSYVQGQLNALQERFNYQSTEFGIMVGLSRLKDDYIDDLRHDLADNGIQVRDWPPLLIRDTKNDGR